MTPAAFGDVKLTGVYGDILDNLIERHAVKEDAMWLADFFTHHWEDSRWQTEFWGKYMHSAAPFVAYCGCPRLRKSVDESTAAIRATQDEEGYIGNFPRDFRCTGTRAVWGFKYTILGLLHHFDLTGDRASLQSACRLCDYMIANFGPGKLSIAENGSYAGIASGSVLEAVMWVYDRTREKKYLEFAGWIVEELDSERGAEFVKQALAGVPVYARSADPKEGESIWSVAARGRRKAYELMSCYQGLLEYYEVVGKPEYLEAARLTAESILKDEINLAGSGSSEEHFFHGAAKQTLPFVAQMETCVTITWMRLCEKLLYLTHDPKWADEIEKTFYNAYLASLSADGSRFASYTPLDGSRSRGMDHCFVHTDCCNENGARGFVTWLQSSLVADGDAAAFNFYTSGNAFVKLPDSEEKAEFDVFTHYPRVNRVVIRYVGAKKRHFELRLRIPSWSANTTIKLNNKEVIGAKAGAYFGLDREWKEGDEIYLYLDLAVRMHRQAGHVAFSRGPVLLARSTRFNDGALDEPLALGRYCDAYEGEVYRYIKNEMPTFTLERNTVDGVAIQVSAVVPMGLHGENTCGISPNTIHFCDFASAGNRWLPTDRYRVWLPRTYFAGDKVDCDVKDPLRAASRIE